MCSVCYKFVFTYCHLLITSSVFALCASCIVRAIYIYCKRSSTYDHVQLTCYIYFIFYCSKWHSSIISFILFSCIDAFYILLFSFFLQLSFKLHLSLLRLLLMTSFVVMLSNYFSIYVKCVVSAE